MGQLKPLEDKLKEHSDNLRRVRQEGAGFEEKCRNELASLNSKREDIVATDSTVKKWVWLELLIVIECVCNVLMAVCVWLLIVINIIRHEARGSSTALESCSVKVAELGRQIDAKTGEKIIIDNEIDTLRRQLANAKVSWYLKSCDNHVTIGERERSG